MGQVTGLGVEFDLQLAQVFTVGCSLQDQSLTGGFALPGDHSRIWAFRGTKQVIFWFTL